MDGFAVVAIECMHYSIQTGLSVCLELYRPVC